MSDKSTQGPPPPVDLRRAWESLDRALVHLRDEQLCGIWPDGSALRGAHIKHLVTELKRAPPSPPRREQEPPTP